RRVPAQIEHVLSHRSGQRLLQGLDSLSLLDRDQSFAVDGEKDHWHIRDYRSEALFALPQRILRLAALGEIEVRAGHAIRFSLLVAQRHTARENPAVCSIFV